MTGTTITESKQKLTHETGFTHQENPVRKGKKGGKKQQQQQQRGMADKATMP
jgi:hypothetical protein